MPKKEEHGVAPVACNSRCQLSYVISFFLHANILLSLAFSQLFFFSACEGTCFLIHLRFREGKRTAAPAKNAKTLRRVRIFIFLDFFKSLLDRLFFLVFFARAAFGMPSRERKCISRRVNAQAKKRQAAKTTRQEGCSHKKHRKPTK